MRPRPVRRGPVRPRPIRRGACDRGPRDRGACDRGACDRGACDEKGGLVPWGPSYQWADSSLRFHTFATVLGLTLVALAKLALGSKTSARTFLRELADINATLVRTSTGEKGRRPTVMLPPELSATQRKAVDTFELARWMPALSSTMNGTSMLRREPALWRADTCEGRTRGFPPAIRGIAPITSRPPPCNE